MKRKILIATHSTFASGILGSIELLIGKRSEISIVDAFVDESNYVDKVDLFFTEYDEADEYIVFTDLFGGSVNQKIFSYKDKFNFFLITGFNLPILLEIILFSENLTEDTVDDLVEKCRNELKVVTKDEVEEQKDDEEDFL